MAFSRGFCHAYIETHDSAWKLALAFPGVALWLTLDGFGLWHPQRECRMEWKTPVETFWIGDDRKCGISMSDWTLRLEPWAKSMEWCAADPWWIRGVSVNLADLILGRRRCETETLKDGIPLQIPLPEGCYSATAKVVKRTWKRSRWFAFSRVSTEVTIPKGLPFAGKGENSWDCGDDGLYGYGVDGTSLEHAIAHGVESVLVSRRRYGHASPQAVAEGSRMSDVGIETQTTCLHCGEDIRHVDGQWIDCETHSTCKNPDEDADDLRRHEPISANKCGRDHGPVPSCALCEVLEHNQERAFSKGHCGSLSAAPHLLVCDRESGHKGQHRGYDSQHDEVFFWAAR